MSLEILYIFIGAVVGYVARQVLATKKAKEADRRADTVVRDAKTKAKEELLEAKENAVKLLDKAKNEEIRKRKEFDVQANKLAQKEEQVEQKVVKIELIQEKLEKKIQQIQDKQIQLNDQEKKSEEKLLTISALTKDEAKKIVLERAESEAGQEILQLVQKIETDAKHQAEGKARSIISSAIQKYAADVVAESTVTAVELPNDEMKGRIIGREGRNINAFELAAGVDVIVDDSPNVVMLSAFDPMRRYVAKIALEKLIADGRIHPTRIEESLKKANSEVAKLVKELGEKAVFEAGVSGLNPNIVKLLGRLRFRSTYGQNVLKHSVEVSLLAGALAAELGADVSLCQKAGLLHDIGRAVDHEVPGHHADIGHDICKKFNIQKDIQTIVGEHHRESGFSSVEAVVVNAANLISNARPGAQKNALESYIKRLTDLENIAKSFDGVDTVFAVQAGREIRIVVKPDVVDDYTAQKLAKEIAVKIEQELHYPGQVKVHVMRETRMIDYAR